MIYGASDLIGKYVTSLRADDHIGHIGGLLVDPFRLAVAGFWIEPRLRNRQGQTKILLPTDIRQLTSRQIVVNDHNALTNPNDLPKLTKILQIQYSIPGKRIIGAGRKIGIASDFNFNNNTYHISHIIGRPANWRRLKLSQLLFERANIIRLEDKQIIVNIGPQKKPVAATSLGPTPI